VCGLKEPRMLLNIEEIIPRCFLASESAP
jgi:hypothetical protein